MEALVQQVPLAQSVLLVALEILAQEVRLVLLVGLVIPVRAVQLEHLEGLVLKAPLVQSVPKVLSDPLVHKDPLVQLVDVYFLTENRVGCLQLDRSKTFNFLNLPGLRHFVGAPGNFFIE